MKQFLQKSVFPTRQNSNDEDLAKMIALDFQPFLVVDEKGFRKFIQAVNPMHAIPSGKTLVIHFVHNFILLLIIN